MWLQQCLHFSKRWYTVPVTKSSFENCASFVECMPQIDEPTTYDAEDLELVMSMYNLIEYRLNYSEATGTLWFYSKDEATDFGFIL